MRRRYKNKKEYRRIPKRIERVGTLAEICDFYKEITGEEVPAETVDHEEAHYQEARRLGYDPKFRITFGTRAFTTINVVFDEEVLPEHKRQIALAPKEPSFDDLFISQRCAEAEAGE